MSMHPVSQRVSDAIRILRQALEQERGSQDHWTGALSTSALSTATAISALSVCVREYESRPWNLGTNDNNPSESPTTWKALIERGSQWLVKAQNEDGGFGDTDRSLSNIATTLLVVAAWELAGHTDRFPVAVQAARKYVERQGSWDGLRRRYGKDKTFVVPIMTNCALAGLVDWSEIPTLPFEAAALPQSWYRFAQMPVVSYAIPALVAIGQAQFHHHPPKTWVMRRIRSLCLIPTRRVLTRMQPTSGGFLEATPLTSFVLMNLASIQQATSRVATEARKFIVNSVLEDGSWPIDTNLATWVTSLATVPFFEEDPLRVPGTGSSPTPMDSKSRSANDAASSMRQWNRTIDWILACQHRRKHPFTGAHPGGWGWTNLSGAVPDADDTPAALLALHQWHRNYLQQIHSSAEPRTQLDEDRHHRVTVAAKLGVQWLLRLQNRDGGWPTFCRGWGTLPFDRSGSDLTAHALRALSSWQSALQALPNTLDASSSRGIERAICQGFRFLERQQHADGSWLPLWFGNQDRNEEDNPVYGTGRVLLGFSTQEQRQSQAFRRGVRYLLSSQNRDGSWGGGPNARYPQTTETQPTLSGTIEETAIALEGILMEKDTTDTSDSILRGLDWLCQAIRCEHHRISQPIGFYFARLWYYEKMYPLVFSLSALQQGLQFCQR
jgi:squalene-hopene/tetraprenyl-beta-curcumene cyclase